MTAAFAAIVSAAASAGDEVPVSASEDGNHADFSDKPAPDVGDVLTTNEMDADAAGRASALKVGRNEVALTVTSDGTVHARGGSNSQASCLAGGGGYCLHTHPKQRYTGTFARYQSQDHRLGFGPEDWRIVQRGTPNYMLNYKRDLFVLEYRNDTGYTPRYIQNVPLR